MRVQATITKWKDRFGFATADDLSRVICVHQKALPRSAGARRVGLVIECEAVEVRKGRKPQARNIRLVDPPTAVQPARQLPPKIAALLDPESRDDGRPKRKTKRVRKIS